MSTSSVISPVCQARRLRLPWTLTPENAALLVRDDSRPFALIGRWAGGGALIGSEPVRVAAPDEDPFALLDDVPEIDFEASGTRDHDSTDEDIPIAGGWFGWLGYALGRRIEAVSAGPPPVRRAAYSLAFYDHLLRLDAAGRWWFEALWSDERDHVLRARMDTLNARAAAGTRPRPFSTETWQATPTAPGHARAVEACRERILAGDLFQANICVRLDSRLHGSPIDLFATAAAALAPDRAAFLGAPSGAIASLSPELFLQRRGHRVRSAPIKGTRARPADAALAAARRAELQRSSKDRAENVMIVDLVRNDLGRVCEPGSIDVEVLCDARAHTGVWHLVSEICGELRDGVTNSDLVRAAFPPGSVSGAPKVAAMNVIAELESTSRRLYTGAIGFASPTAGLELSVAIRTFEFAGDRAWLGVGGGIVAESDPIAEARECMTKATPLLAAIGAELEGGAAGLEGAAAELVGQPAEPEGQTAGLRAQGVAPPTPRRLAPEPLPRPDPAWGVFETLRVDAGRPVALDLHLRRLSHSARELYEVDLPSGLAGELRAASAVHGDARMRVDLRPDGHTGIELTPLLPRSTPLQLRATAVPGGLGAHKWSDRRLLAALSADADGDEPLLCDLDGTVLETARATVFVVEDSGRLLTPPDDGRILPGVTRARVLAVAERLGYAVVSEPLALARVAEAREIFLTGALGGVEPAQLAGRPPATGAATLELAAALARDACHQFGQTCTDGAAAEY